MKNKKTIPRSGAPLQADPNKLRANQLRAQGRYQEALDICLRMARAHPELWGAWFSAATNCFQMERWQEAIQHGNTALAHGGDSIALYDLMAHAHGMLRQWDAVRRYGLQALEMRAARWSAPPDTPAPPPPPLPPPPSAATRERNIIAFSLFGANSRYCEPAVLNVLDQPRIYPHWVCRFYVDDSVPADVIGRLRAGGAQIVRVQGAAAAWPGTMWRFLALDDPQAHRVLLRDADSVIGPREATAVAQWLASDKRFHIIRDWGSHTELILAGLWGAVAGALPPLAGLMQRFMRAPLQSQHFADQDFLRQYVWPHVRTSLMQHDSVFGFMDAAPFPDHQSPGDFHVGSVESAPSFTAQCKLPEGSAVTWKLLRIEKTADGQPREETVCAYAGTVRGGIVKANLPNRYIRWIQQGSARIRVLAGRAREAALIWAV